MRSKLPGGIMAGRATRARCAPRPVGTRSGDARGAAQLAAEPSGGRDRAQRVRGRGRRTGAVSRDGAVRARGGPHDALRDHRLEEQGHTVGVVRPGRLRLRRYQRRQGSPSADRSSSRGTAWLKSSGAQASWCQRSLESVSYDQLVIRRGQQIDAACHIREQAARARRRRSPGQPGHEVSEQLLLVQPGAEDQSSNVSAGELTRTYGAERTGATRLPTATAVSGLLLPQARTKPRLLLTADGSGSNRTSSATRAGCSLVRGALTRDPGRRRRPRPVSTWSHDRFRCAIALPGCETDPPAGRQPAPAHPDLPPDTAPSPPPDPAPDGTQPRSAMVCRPG